MKRIIIAYMSIALIAKVPFLHAQLRQNDSESSQVKQFVHPGMMQNRQDLEFMKQKVKAGEQPWKGAFERLQNSTSLDFKPQPFTHVVRGSYGRKGEGHRELSASASAAYHHALMWYITDEKAYAQKAIEILNAWSPVLWDFDENDAKLIAGLTGAQFLNAAELLKYTDSGWKEKDIDQFKRMMLTVYYPTIKNFFTEANGNWDAAMINTMLCIGIFNDDHEIFNRAVDRFYRGPNNSGITKYIYTNGQIQESTRDWPHVQLGLGELAKASQVAWTQGLDFYSTAGNRLALGFEYTAKYMLGEDVPAYGVISPRGRGSFRDIYESVYHHYRFVKGLDMPYTARAIEHTRPESSIMLLTAIRAPVASVPEAPAGPPPLKAAAPQTGALATPTAKPPVDAIIVMPGDSIQAALNASAGKGGWVIMAKGVHTLNAPLHMPGGVTLAGQGKESVLFLDPELTTTTIVNADNDMHDVTIRDLLIEGATSVDPGSDPNQGRRARARQSAPRRDGIVFSALHDGQMRNIRFEHLTVQNFTKNGVSIRGAAQVVIDGCDFSDNGSNVVPGPGLHHNLHLTHVIEARITNSRFDTSPWGSGLDLSFSRDVVILNNELARNKLQGIRCTESRNVKVTRNLLEGNDGSGILFDALMDGSGNVEVRDNLSRNNGAYGISIDHVAGGVVRNNTALDNGHEKQVFIRASERITN